MAKILLAEDEDSVREFVRRGLVGHGYEVKATADGGEALEALAHDQFDLVLADIVMPVMDGIALALKLAAERPDLPVLLMTGYAMEKQRAHHLDCLVSDVLSKPFSLDQLLRAVRQTLKAEQPKA
ncbi:response regulator MprA [alpha proteobacterium Q-1]|nr:response regulator MprA [alpha proteobacterium Q-1]